MSGESRWHALWYGRHPLSLLLAPLGWLYGAGMRLRRLVYASGVLGVLHFFWKVKADTRWPLVATAVLVVLLAARLKPWMDKRRRAQPLTT